MEAPKTIPDNLLSEYTLGDQIPIREWYLSELESKTINWTDEVIQKHISQFSNYNIYNKLTEPEPYYNASSQHLQAINK